jgi:hypothetical protein
MRTRLIRAAALSAAATTVARVLARRAEERADERFDVPDPSASTLHEVGSLRVRTPVVYHRSDAIAAVFSADLEAVRAALPSPDLYPVRLPKGRAAFAIAAYRHLESTWTDAAGAVHVQAPYAEVAIGPWVSRRPLPPVLPLLFDRVPALRSGVFLLHLPVTAAEPRDAGRAIWGVPKFVADMEFSETQAERSCALSEDGTAILTLIVKSGGRVSRTRAPGVLYSVHDGRLLEIVCPVRAVRAIAFGGGGALELGDHEISTQLRDLDVAATSFATSTYVSARMLLPAGTDIGAAKPYEGRAGRSVGGGTFRMRYPDGSLIDLGRRDDGGPARDQALADRPTEVAEAAWS